MFYTVLHKLKSPQNVGMIVRSHAAHAGKGVIFTGDELPWAFKKGSQSFSRKLEQQVAIHHIANPLDAIAFLHKEGYAVVAVEISADTQAINKFTFPEKTAIVLGNEADGLPQNIIDESDYVVTIPQYAAVGSLNVAVSASIAMYEMMKGKTPHPIAKGKYV